MKKRSARGGKRGGFAYIRHEGFSRTEGFKEYLLLTCIFIVFILYSSLVIANESKQESTKNHDVLFNLICTRPVHSELMKMNKLIPKLVQRDLFSAADNIWISSGFLLVAENCLWD